jgi:hypothetical protein
MGVGVVEEGADCAGFDVFGKGFSFYVAAIERHPVAPCPRRRDDQPHELLVCDAFDSAAVGVALLPGSCDGAKPLLRQHRRCSHVPADASARSSTQDICPDATRESISRPVASASSPAS